jgi:hypothetical protein
MFELSRRKKNLHLKKIDIALVSVNGFGRLKNKTEFYDSNSGFYEPHTVKK